MDPWVFIICRKSVFRHLCSVLNCRFSKGAVKTTAHHCTHSLPLEGHIQRNPPDVPVPQTNMYSSLALWHSSGVLHHCRSLWDFLITDLKQGDLLEKWSFLLNELTPEGIIALTLESLLNDWWKLFKSFVMKTSHQITRYLGTHQTKWHLWLKKKVLQCHNV